MLLPDDLIIKKNCSKAMIKVHKKYSASVMASMKVKKNNVSRWGIYKINKKLNKRNYIIDGVVEKPSLKKHHQIMLLLEDIYYRVQFLKKLNLLNLVKVKKYI